jgi:hypothetical protein
MVQLRRCEKYTVYRSTEVINLDPEKFRDLKDFPYTGETDEEFLQYISESGFHIEIPEDVDDDTRNELFKIQDGTDWIEYDPEHRIRIQYIDRYLKTGGGKKSELLELINEELIKNELRQITFDELKIDLQEYFSSVCDEHKSWFESGNMFSYKGVAENYDIDLGDDIPRSTSYEDGC